MTPRRLAVIGLVAMLAAGCSAAFAPTAPARTSGIAEPHTAEPSPGSTVANPPSSGAAEPRTAEPSPGITPADPPSTDLGASAWSVKAVGGGVWIQVDPPVDQLVKVGTETGEPTVMIDGGRGIGTDGVEVWVALGPDGLAKIDAATGETLLTVPADASYAALGSGSVWATHGDGIGRWDTATGELPATIPVDVTEVTELLFAHDSVWITAKEDAVVLRIDPSSNEVVATIETGLGAHGLAAEENALWVTNYRANSVSRIDPATDEVVATIAGVGSGVGIAAAEGAIWASVRGVGIARIDTATDEAQLIVELPGQWNYGLAYDSGTLWVTSVERGLVYRIELDQLDS